MEGRDTKQRVGDSNGINVAWKPKRKLLRILRGEMEPGTEDLRHGRQQWGRVVNKKSYNDTHK